MSGPGGFMDVVHSMWFLNACAIGICVIGFPLTFAWIVVYFRKNRNAFFAPQLYGIMFWELVTICWQIGDLIGYQADDQRMAKIHYLIMGAILAAILCLGAVGIGISMRKKSIYS